MEEYCEKDRLEEADISPPTTRLLLMISRRTCVRTKPRPAPQRDVLGPAISRTRLDRAFFIDTVAVHTGGPVT